MGLPGIFQLLRCLNILDPEVFEFYFDRVNLFIEVFVVFLYVEELLFPFDFLLLVLLFLEGLFSKFLFKLINFI